MQAGELVERLENRVRGHAHTYSFMIQLIHLVQEVVNAATGLVLETVTIPTNAHQQIYWTEPLMPNLVSLKAVRDGIVDTDRIFDPMMLYYQDRRWSRQVASQHKQHMMLGRDLLILHPAKNYDSEVEAVYIKLTEPVTSGTSEIDLPTERVQLIVDIAELLLLLRERRLEALGPLLERVARELGADIRAPE